MIGKNLVAQSALDPQIKESLELVAFTRQESDTSYLESSGIEFRCIDYRNPDSFSGKLADIDVFVHLAGLTRAVTPAGYYRANVDATACLLDALSLFGKGIKHFIFVSSTSASGPAASPYIPKTEEDPCRPVSHYGKSKLQAEALVRSCPINWTILRLPIVFGPHDYDMLKMFRVARSGLVILFSRPKDPYTYVSAPDVARFLLQAAQDQRLFGGTYCYSYDTPMPERSFFPHGSQAARHAGNVPPPSGAAMDLLSDPFRSRYQAANCRGGHDRES